MKEGKIRREAVQGAARDYHSKLKWLFLVFLCLTGFTKGIYAQCTLPESLFHPKEEISYELYFKWGILMPKAGVATAVMNESSYNGAKAWKYRLLLNTTGMVDKMTRVRDTIDSYYSYRNPKVLFSAKHSNEVGYYQIDRLTFMEQDGEHAVHTFRRSTNKIKIDSVMVGERCIYDILSALTHIRSLDWTNMQIGDEVQVQVAMGRDMINTSYRYAGQQIIERGNVKYRTRLFYVDAYDEAFTQSKEAAEVWIGDDENHIPIKIRAKLKIGAAEAYFNDGVNLKHPLACRIVVPKR